MSTAVATGEMRVSAEAVHGVLSDLAGWAWVPGVAAIEVHDRDEADWTIDTPVGPAHVPLRFVFDDGGVRFEPRATPRGPFSVVSGRLDVEGLPTGSSIRFELTLEGAPPPPPPLAAMVAEGAVAGLGRRLVAERPPAVVEPELLAVEMSDGVALAVHHYRAPAAVAAVVLLVIPYRKEGAFVRELARVFTSAGYHFLVADVRGIGGSVAPYEGLLSDREVTDHAELIEWAADQEWSDGNVATMGASYCGANQLLVAARRPRGLRCIAPVVGPVDTYRDWTHRGGIPTHTLWGVMTYLGSQHRDTFRRGIEQYYLDFMSDPLDNEGHRRRSPEYVLGQVAVPALVMGGWHDYFLRPTVRTYLGVGGPRRLLIGPWGHGDFTPRHEEELLAWFGWWLRGEGADPTGGETVHLYTTGRESWHSRKEWPQPASVEWRAVRPIEGGGSSPTTVYTHAFAVMPASNPKRQYVPDPTDSGFGLWGESATFDTDPLDADLVCEGPVGLTVGVRADGACSDFDVNARVSVVRSDGSVTQLCEGRLRASHRKVDPSRSLSTADGTVIVPWHPHDEEEAVEAGAASDLCVEMYPMSHAFAKGERIRLGLTLTRADEGAVPVPAVLTDATVLRLPLA